MLTRQDIENVITACDQAILTTLGGGVSSFSVAGGTSYTNISLKEIKELRSQYAWMLYLYDHSKDGCTVRTFPQWIDPHGSGQ